MIHKEEHPLPEDLEERVKRAYLSRRLTLEDKKELSIMFGMAMMMAAAVKQMLDDHGVS